MWDTIINVLIMLLLPAILKNFISFIKVLLNWKKYVIFYRPKPASELGAIILALIYSSWILVRLYQPSNSYFSITSTSINSPSYLVRNKFRAYIHSQERIDETFKSMMTIRNSHVQESTEFDIISKTYTPFKNIEEPFIELEKMSITMRSNDKRKNYIMFGEEAMKCDICDKNPWMRALFILPAILKDYFIFLVVCGLLTSYYKKSNWRIIFGTCIALMVAVEIYIWGFSESLTVEFLDVNLDYYFLTRPEQMFRIRHLIFLLLVSIITIVDFETIKSPIVTSLTESLKIIEASVAQLQASRLARMAIMRDDTLRKHSWEYFKRVEQEKQHLFNDPEYKKSYAELARKYNLDSLLEKSNEMMQSTFDSFFGKSN